MRDFEVGEYVNVIQYFGLSRVAWKGEITKAYPDHYPEGVYLVKDDNGFETWVRHIDLADAN